MTVASSARGALVLLGVSAAAGPALAQKSTGAILPGGNSKQPISIEAAKLDYFDKEQKLIYTGNVVAVQGDSKLKSSVLTILLAPKSQGGSGDGAAGAASSKQIQKMLATGPVTLVQKDQVGTGDNGVYDKVANTVILTGNVVLSQGPNITKGDKLVYDLRSGHATVTGGRVVGMFTPGGDGPAASKGVEAASGETNEVPRRSGRKPSSR